jgi:hypothetical protein
MFVNVFWEVFFMFLVFENVLSCDKKVKTIFVLLSCLFMYLT